MSSVLVSYPSYKVMAQTTNPNLTDLNSCYDYMHKLLFGGIGNSKSLRSPFDSMREDVFTVSPKRQYRGIFSPTTPAQTGPETHIRMEMLFKTMHACSSLVYG